MSDLLKVAEYLSVTMSCSHCNSMNMYKYLPDSKFIANCNHCGKFLFSDGSLKEDHAVDKKEYAHHDFLKELKEL